MAEPPPQTTNPPAMGEEPLQQPAGAVPLKEIVTGGEEEAQAHTDAGPSLSAADQGNAQPDQTAASEAETAGAVSVDAPPKGKGKAEPQPPAVRTQEDDLTIGPTEPVSNESNTPPDHPVCNITLLLPTGARHPYKLDEKYLAKRNVDVPGWTDAGKKDPFSISVYTLKELILREWREEWENRPASPSSIRLIHFGKLLEDKEQLKSKHFSPITLHSLVSGRCSRQLT